MFNAYILFSKSFAIYYKGFTTDIFKRIEYHNSGKSPYTSKTGDWVVVYTKAYEAKKEALIEEKSFKKVE